MFHGRVPYNVLNLKMSIRPQRIHTTNSKIAEDVLKQTGVIFHDVRKNTMQTYFKHKTYYDKEANKEQQYLYVLQPKVEHQGSKIPFTDF